MKWFISKKDKKLFDEEFMRNNLAKKLVKKYNLWVIIFLILFIAEIGVCFLEESEFVNNVVRNLIELFWFFGIFAFARAEGRVEGAFQQYKVFKNKK